ncbi:hypothetical protein CPB86DRAFT_592465 [Serendipita vermifera]|nr:hypothetical protein CPB86DRAFT_592465 [Serendipita vermifera]
MLLSREPDPSEPHLTNLLTQILTKMSRHPKVFRRVVGDLQEYSLRALVPPFLAFRPSSQSEAKLFMKSITAMASSPKWQDISSEEEISLLGPEAILHCLQILHPTPICKEQPTAHRVRGTLAIIRTARRDKNEKMKRLLVSTSWIFTLGKCPSPTDNADNQHSDIENRSTEENRSISSIERFENSVLRKLFLIPTWPDPPYYAAIRDAFNNEDLRRDAVYRYIDYIDACLSSIPVSSPQQTDDWRWHPFTVEPQNLERATILKILVEYILPAMSYMEEESLSSTNVDGKTLKSRKVENRHSSSKRLETRLQKIARRGKHPALRQALQYYSSGYLEPTKRSEVLEASQVPLLSSLQAEDGSSSLDAALLYVFELRLGLHDHRIFKDGDFTMSDSRENLIFQLLIMKSQNIQLEELRKKTVEQVSGSLVSLN